MFGAILMPLATKMGKRYKMAQKNGIPGKICHAMHYAEIYIKT